ncbi:MAG: hypothetical protein ABIB71_02090 [Candidatus Woesearchaeota archaeon]
MTHNDPLAARIGDQAALELLHNSVFDILGSLKNVEDEEVVNEIYHKKYSYERGRILLDRDPNIIKIHAFTNLDKEIVLFRIRDRRHDGTSLYQSPLRSWSYDSEHDKVDGKAVELSTYSRDPEYYLKDPELKDFIGEPFDFMFGDEAKFIALWKKAFVSGHFPGQSALPLKNAAKYFVDNAEKLVNKLGYEATISPSHYNVAESTLNWGFSFQSSVQEREFNELNKVLSEFDFDRVIENQQRSWIVLLQKFPKLKESELAGYWLKGLEFPLYYDGQDVENVWMCRKGKFKDYAPKKCLERLEAYDGCH